MARKTIAKKLSPLVGKTSKLYGVTDKLPRGMSPKERTVAEKMSPFVRSKRR